MSAIPVAEVQVGDRLRARDGTEMTVSRIDQGFLGRPGMVALIEDSDAQWFKLPAPADGEVELVSRA